MKTVLITGATSGIGQATAKKLAKNFRLIVCGRRQERLDELVNELSALTEIVSLNFDVRNRNEVFEAIERLPENFKSIDILINNAGNAHGLAPLDEADLDDLDAMIDGNVKGMIYVTKAILPYMISSGKGHIVNISSIAGKHIYPNGATYCASKWAVEALSKGMRIDFQKHGIKVTIIAPGAVETEFSMVRYKGDSDRAKKVYEGYEPLVAEDIADSIEFAISQPDHVQIADLTITPKAQTDTGQLFRN